MPPQLRPRGRRAPDARDDDDVKSEVDDSDAPSNTRGGGFTWRGLLPYVLITVVLTLPRVAYEGYYWYYLRSGLVTPYMAPEDTKQVLIVGTMGSGTNQMSAELRQLGFWVAHESSDSGGHFARDGTISWIHGMRFLNDTPMLGRLCNGPLYNAFHPTMFRPSSKCSYHFTTWSDCWTNECADLVRSEYGCAVRETATCTTPFRRTLLQVRNPLRTIASLVSKSAPNCSNGRYQLAAIQGLLPTAHDWTSVTTCEEAFGWYYVLYTEALLEHADDVYRVEHTTPAEVAKLAGLANETLEDREDAPGHGESHGYKNRKNTKGFNITWADYDGTPQLQKRLKALTMKLGYDL